jgi:hypothetical protein
VHPITVILGVIAAVLFAISGRGVDDRRVTRYGDLVAWGLFFLTLTLMAAFLLRGEDVFYLID